MVKNHDLFLDLDYQPRKRTIFVIQIDNKKYSFNNKLLKNLHFHVEKIFSKRWPRRKRL